MSPGIGVVKKKIAGAFSHLSAYQDNQPLRLDLLAKGADMNFNKYHRLTAWLGIAVLMAASLACNLTTATPASTPNNPTSNTASTATVNSATEPAVATVANSAPSATLENTATATSTAIAHVMTPGEPPASANSALSDSNSSTTASANRANGGDNFNMNLYERPFSSNGMNYLPDLDITSAKLMQDATWVYVNISLAGQNSAGGLQGDYGVELDLNRDGRGDLLVMAAKPGSSWSTDGVRAWTDSNNDVGGARPIMSDPPSNTTGYDTTIFDQGVGSDPDAAWARISPSDPNSVQVAFKYALTKGTGSFLWGVWAMDDSMLHPDWFDYNDHFTLAQAGSPLIEDTQNYPLKALAEIDNTCRWVVGFNPTGNEPGICPVPATPTPKPTATPILPGTISGTVYNNGVNGGLKYSASVSKPASGISVTARSGSCGSGGGVVGSTSTNGSGNYSFTLKAGTYCISAAAPSSNQTSPQTVKLPNGGNVTKINFFYYEYLG